MPSKLSLIYKRTGLALIGFVSLFYFTFFSYFAQVKIELPFLNFPVFVGEMLLAACFLILILKWIDEGVKFRWYHGLTLGLMVWVMIKALSGYFEYGHEPYAL